MVATVSQPGSLRAGSFDEFQEPLSGVAILVGGQPAEAEGNGDGGPSIDALFSSYVTDMTVDDDGNVFIADRDWRQIRKIDGQTGQISSIFDELGAPTPNYCDEPHTSPISGPLGYPWSLAAANESVFFSLGCGGGGRVQLFRWTEQDGIALVAGGMYCPDAETLGCSQGGAFAGDGGPAIGAGFGSIDGLVIGSEGDIYIADATSCRVRKIESSSQIISTVAGSTCVYGGTLEMTLPLGDGGLALNAQFYQPSRLALSQDELVLYVLSEADGGKGRRVRAVDLVSGIISTVAGTGQEGIEGDGGPATAAKIYPTVSISVLPNGELALFSPGPIELESLDTPSVRPMLSLSEGAGSCQTETSELLLGGPGDEFDIENNCSQVVIASGDLLTSTNGDCPCRVEPGETELFQHQSEGIVEFLSEDNQALDEVQLKWGDGEDNVNQQSPYNLIRAVDGDGTIDTFMRLDGPHAGRGSVGKDGSLYTLSRVDPSPTQVSYQLVRYSSEVLGLWSDPECTIMGSQLDETIQGTGLDDVICAGDGNDVVAGGGGNDVIYGGDGDDIIDCADSCIAFGGNGSDEIILGSGGGLAFGNDDDDVLTGSSGNDTLLGGDGIDRLSGGGGVDFLDAGVGDDLLFGSSDASLLVSTSVTRTASEPQAVNYLVGGNGDDWLDTNSRDVALGGAGNDVCSVSSYFLAGCVVGSELLQKRPSFPRHVQFDWSSDPVLVTWRYPSNWRGEDLLFDVRLNGVQVCESLEIPSCALSISVEEKAFIVEVRARNSQGVGEWSFSRHVRPTGDFEFEWSTNPELDLPTVQ